jgi:hypothetical protein
MATPPSFVPTVNRSPHHRTLAGVLQSEPELAGWTARHRREAELTLLVRKHLPRPVAERVRVTGTREGVLELAAGSGAIAAALRQRAPDLRLSLARDGWDFTEIRVRVQVEPIPDGHDKTHKHQWDSREAAPLFALADQLPDGPLKAAITRWSRRARGR